MYVKKLKRRCSVRGCKNIDTFAISCTREMGNPVIVCRACMEAALAKISETKPQENTAFVCSVCGKTYKSEAGLHKHMAVHEEDAS